MKATRFLIGAALLSCATDFWAQERPEVVGERVIRGLARRTYESLGRHFRTPEDTLNLSMSLASSRIGARGPIASVVVDRVWSATGHTSVIECTNRGEEIDLRLPRYVTILRSGNILVPYGQATHSQGGDRREWYRRRGPGLTNCASLFTRHAVQSERWSVPLIAILPDRDAPYLEEPDPSSSIELTLVDYVVTYATRDVQRIRMAMDGDYIAYLRELEPEKRSDKPESKPRQSTPDDAYVSISERLSRAERELDHLLDGVPYVTVSGQRMYEAPEATERIHATVKDLTEVFAAPKLAALRVAVSTQLHEIPPPQVQQIRIDVPYGKKLLDVVAEEAAAAFIRSVKTVVKAVSTFPTLEPDLEVTGTPVGALVTIRVRDDPALASISARLSPPLPVILPKVTRGVYAGTVTHESGCCKDGIFELNLMRDSRTQIRCKLARKTEAGASYCEFEK